MYAYTYIYKGHQDLSVRVPLHGNRPCLPVPVSPPDSQARICHLLSQKGGSI